MTTKIAVLVTGLLWAAPSLFAEEHGKKGPPLERPNTGYPLQPSPPAADEFTQFLKDNEADLKNGRLRAALPNDEEKAKAKKLDRNFRLLLNKKKAGGEEILNFKAILSTPLELLTADGKKEGPVLLGGEVAFKVQRGNEKEPNWEYYTVNFEDGTISKIPKAPVAVMLAEEAVGWANVNLKELELTQAEWKLKLTPAGRPSDKAEATYTASNKVYDYTIKAKPSGEVSVEVKPVVRRGAPLEVNEK